MLPILPAVLAGGAFALGLRLVKLTKPNLIDRLNVNPHLTDLQHRLPGQAKTLLQAAIQHATASLAAVDQQVQQTVQRYIDPLLFTQVRREQLDILAAGRELVVNEEERAINRNIAVGITAFGTIAATSLTGLPLTPLVLAMGVYLTWPWFHLARKMLVHERRLSVVHLITLYLAGMWLGGYYTIGAIGAIFTGFSQKVMLLTQNSMRRNLVSIFHEQPRHVWIVTDGSEMEIPFEQLKAGDILVVDAGQMLPIDGRIVQGSATIDQQMLTGEAQPAEKGVGELVQAATIVLRGRIFVQVQKTGADTTAAQIGEILNHSADYQLAMEKRAIAIAEKSVWPMLAASVVAMPLVGPGGALAILGSNFVVSMIPLRLLTMLNFLNTASHRGILVKDAAALERMATLTAIVFDKTGTLTLECPQVVQVHGVANWTDNQVLALAAAAEHRQSHPIAQAIRAAAAERQLTLPAIEEAQYEVGYGIQVRLVPAQEELERPKGEKTEDRGQSQILNSLVRVGSLRYMQMEQMAIGRELTARQEVCRTNGHSLVFVAIGDKVAGAIELQPTLRPEAKQVVQALQRRGLALYIISGDQEAPTRQLAQALGVAHYIAGVLPERKAELVAELQQKGQKVCFVGDGINDTIALRQADVSVSLRGATTAATDTAQIVLMDADLDQLDTLFELAQKLNTNIALNFSIAAALSLLSGAGVLLLHLKFTAVETLSIIQIFTGVSIAGKPLLDRLHPTNVEATCFPSST